ncbi:MULTISPECIES: hypothetical protein [Microbacterium]|uniref:hypothetical protein n=1 Tax=Microbacterium TaxID=33882 RepID=UPI00217F0C6E|nr:MULTISPECIES: hypothetical protein [Microbacterium]UWF76913.1 hypothetical protein JSY13_08750 [Microbacterium neungamense]WCM55070.1 hypothetical protein JRG78_08750 [Microbacterium sp. EF45047]
MTKRRALPEALGPAFSVSDARALGVPAARLRAKDLRRRFRGTRERSDAEEAIESDDRPFARDRAQRRRVERMARSFQPIMSPHAFVAGLSAAAIYELPVEHDDELHVCVFAPHRAPRRPGIKARKVNPELASIRNVRGLRVASPASTWAMLARELTVRQLVVLGDAIVRIPRDEFGEPHPELALATVEQLRAAAGAGPRAGVSRLRAALEAIRVGSASPLETEYRLDAVAGGLPEAALDVEIRDGDGRLVGVSEVVYPEYGVVVEVEGDHHRTSRTQWVRDIDKYTAYAALGYEVVRVTSSHIRGEHPRAVAMVRAALQRHGWTACP